MDSVQPKTCSVDGCLDSVYAQGWCAMHYQRVFKKAKYKPGDTRPGCSVEGCDRTAVSKGRCDAHYRRLADGRDPNAPVHRKVEKPCAVEGCERLARTRGLCGSHYITIRNGAGERSPEQACSARGCDRGVYAKGVCSTHYQQVRKRGTVLSRPIRKMGDGHVTGNGGYVIMRAPKGHPNATRSGQILQHRLVMSNHLGRPLKHFEGIHHRNGVRTDNRVENLELTVKQHGPGHSIEDELKRAHEMIALYEPEAPQDGVYW